MKIKKITKFSLTAIMAVSVFISLPVLQAGCATDTPTNNPSTPSNPNEPNVPNQPATPDTDKTLAPIVKGIYSDDYYIPGSNNRNWCEGMVSGNGQNGVITSGAPYSDTLIYQNMSFVMPSAEQQTLADTVSSELQTTIDAVMAYNASWNLNGRTRSYHYNFHPGHELKLTSTEYPINEYKRWTDYTTAEVGVSYSNRYGVWTRTTFTSREDNVTITSIQQSSSGNKINMTVSIDNLSDLNRFGTTTQNGGYERQMQYKKVVDEDLNYIAQVAHYPVTENSTLAGYANAGYAGVTQVVVVGGTKEKVLLGGTHEVQNVGEDANPAIQITDADAVYLITKCDRTFEMGELNNFASSSDYDLVDELFADTNAVVKKYGGNENFDYEKALDAHVVLHKPEFDSVTLDLNASEADRALSTEALLEKQQASSSLIAAFVERAYYAGRYAQICSSGFSAPRLGGMWTGEWNPPWGCEYTLDANVNLQISAMNTGNLTYAPVGYINFILRQLDDWLTNAETIYGMHDAIQSPHFTDGDNALNIQSDGSYPFQYWNSGASWLLLPIYEYWQCYGNQRIPVTEDVDLYKVKRALGVNDGGLTDAEVQAIISRGYLDLESDILLPLLTKQSNFWEQLCKPEYYVDENGAPHYESGKTSLNSGEKYLIIPSYSPENKPQGSYNKPVTMNATMDIAAAKSGLEMTIEMEKAVNGSAGNKQIEKWTNLINLLPDYQYDGEAGSQLTSTGGGGALKEWAINGNYTENNTHRHLSHLYVAWPSYETQNNSVLYAAAKQAMANRIRLNTGDATTGHGWIHQTLIAARLNDSAVVETNMKLLMSSQIYFTSMMTDHNTNRSSSAYCTDTAMGMLGVINESLVYSNTGEIKVLPALVSSWKTGTIGGIMARSQSVIDELSWDVSKGTVSVAITSDINQSLDLSNGLGYANVTVTGCEYTVKDGVVTLEMKAGEKVRVTFNKNTATASLTAVKYYEGYLPTESRRLYQSSKKLAK